MSHREEAITTQCSKYKVFCMIELSL